MLSRYCFNRFKGMVMSIVLKDKVYFFRGYVPKRLLNLLKQQTFDKSLKTKNKKRAIILAKPLHIKFKYLMKELEMSLSSQDDLYLHLNNFLNKHLIDREKYLFNMPFTEIEEQFNSGYFAESIDTLQYVLSSNDFSIINTIIRNALNDLSGIDNNTKLQAEQYIAKILLEQAVQIREKVIDGYYDVRQASKTIEPTDNTSTKTVSTIKPNTFNLELYINDFLNYAENEYSNANSSINLRKTALSTLLYEFGNCDIRSIELDELLEYKNKLSLLPLKATDKTNRDFSDCKSLNDIINRNHGLAKDTLSTNTIGKYIQVVKQFFKFCVSKTYIKSNIADSLRLKKSSKHSDTNQTEPMPNQDLNTLFSSKFFTTDLSKNLNKYPERIFSPIIAIYSGMRLNELASLYIDNISSIDNTYYFDIIDTEDKLIKSQSSIRRVPIHKKIIEAGFLQYVESIKDNPTKRVWQSLKKSSKSKNSGDGYYSTQLSNWFRVYRNKIGITDKNRTFHSLRHNFINNLKQQRVDLIEIKQLSGHSNNDITLDRYSEGYHINSLHDTINKVYYPIPALEVLIPKIASLIS